MKKPDLSKIFFYTTLAIIALIFSFSYGFYSSSSRNWVFQTVHSIQSDVRSTFEEKDNLAGTRPKYFLQPARYEGSGVTVNKTGDDNNDLIFISGFFDAGNEIRLIRRNGETVARWPVKYSEYFPDASHMEYPPSTDWNIDIHGALALPDGSVVFSFEYGGLVKLDRCGKKLWTLALPSHHSVELAEDGGFWVPGRKSYSAEQPSPFPLMLTPFREDTIMKVAEDGALITEISVPKLFFDNGLEYLLTSTGESMAPNRNWDREIIHLNKIAELKSDIADDFPLFEAGDLLLSLRLYNMILVVDPHTLAIKWWKIGPWKRQHDPEFIPGGKILVFNNNSYSTGFGAPLDMLDLPTESNIIEIDPVTGQHITVYGEDDDQKFFTLIRGKHEFMSHGGLLITEFEGGRLFDTNSSGQIVWEYINRYNEDEIAELTEARIYPASYFDVKNWSCSADNN